MNLIKKIALMICGILTMLACNTDVDITNPGLIGGNNGGEEIPVPDETIEYRAQVWVEKNDLKRYGGERVFKNNLKKMFRNTTRFWNESTNKFKYYFNFVPADELVIYDIAGDRSRYKVFKEKAFNDPFNTEKYDFILFMALDSDPSEAGLSCGGGGKDGQSVVMCYTKADLNIFTDAEYPNQGTYSNLGHEYGHVRGAADLYQYLISAENNPISHEAFTPPACNMGTSYRVWSDYCSALFNFDAYQKQLDKDLHQKTFPAKLLIKVTKDGQPRSGAKVKLWGARGGSNTHKPDVYNAEGHSPFLERTTNTSGELVLNNVYEMYHKPQNIENGRLPNTSGGDDFPFARWYCFLVEVVDGSTNRCVWLSDLDICTDHMATGKDTYELEIAM